jgi:hypothetical protein
VIQSARLSKDSTVEGCRTTSVFNHDAVLDQSQQSIIPIFAAWACASAQTTPTPKNIPTDQCRQAADTNAATAKSAAATRWKCAGFIWHLFVYCGTVYHLEPMRRRVECLCIRDTDTS